VSAAEREPGIYRDVPMEDYLASAGLSRSRLVRLLTETPLRFHHGGDVEETPAMRLGTAVHLGILEPARFDELVRPMPKFDGRTNAGKAGKAEWLAANPGKIAVPEADYEQAIEASRLVRRKRGPAEALRNGHAELSMWWQRDGVLLRSRPDFLDVERGICCDVKTTSRGLDDRAVVSILEDQHAAMQAAMVRMGVHALTGKDIGPGMHLLVIDMKGIPIDMRLVEIGEAWLTRGETQVMTALRIYRECVESGKWPGYADQGVTSAPPIPSWLASRDEREALANMNP
jgi:hypothetical protein